MRISDDRYHNERTRMELALRFLRHEARTQTIRKYTGLSADRIRKLYRSYLGEARQQHPRHRGKSPHQIAYFSRSVRRQQETSLLASVLSLLGLLPAAPPREDSLTPGLARGALLCESFETFRQLLPSAQISFEHTAFLVDALQRGDLLRLSECAECGALMVTEQLTLRATRCQHCAGGAPLRH